MQFVVRGGRGVEVLWRGALAFPTEEPDKVKGPQHAGPSIVRAVGTSLEAKKKCGRK
jgi:hypothetical protein